jgi:hypothetical protein
MIKRYVKEGSGKTGPKMRIGRAVMALTILSSVSLFGSGVVRSQTITFAGDADQGEGGHWMRSKVEQFAKETGIEVHYVARPVSTTETLILWQQDWAAQTQRISFKPQIKFSMGKYPLMEACKLWSRKSSAIRVTQGQMRSPAVHVSLANHSELDCRTGLHI